MRLIHVLSLSLLLPGAACAKSAKSEARVGKPAPEFSLPDTRGNTHALKDAQGKWVVLEWYNDDCPYVKKHYGSGNMQSLQREFVQKGVVWYTVISSAEGKQGHVTPEQGEVLRQERKAASIATLLDPSGKVGRAYGAKTTPHMYVISPEGALIYNGAIDSIRSVDPEDIPKAENYVRAALTAAMSGKKVEKPVTQPYGCSVKYK